MQPPGSPVDPRLQFKYCAYMARKKTAQKSKKQQKKSDPLASLERLGGKKLVQHGAEESLQGKASRQHSVGGGKRG
jgi:hypothetical protein